jgi:hypothetical protein
MPLRDRTKSIGITRFLCRIVDTVVGEHPFHTSVKKGRVCDGSGPGEARLAWAGWSLYQAGRSRLTVRRGRSLVGDFLPSELSAEDDPGADSRKRDALEQIIDRPIYVCSSYQQGRRERGENHVGAGVGKARAPYAPGVQTQPGQDDGHKDSEDGSAYHSDEGICVL